MAVFASTADPDSLARRVEKTSLRADLHNAPRLQRAKSETDVFEPCRASDDLPEILALAQIRAGRVPGR